MTPPKTVSSKPADPSGGGHVAHKVEEYLSIQMDSKGGSLERQQTYYDKMVDNFFDLVTDFYEFGWGDSFHFAPRLKEESFEASLAHHQHFLARRLDLKPGMRVVDLGCGIGGPMRSIARFSEAHITGVNINAYQIKRGKILNQKAGLTQSCGFLQADYMHLPFAENSLDAGFEILETSDLALTSDSETPWYLPLSEPGLSLKGLRCSRTGRWVTNNVLRVAELFGLVPKGSRAVSTFLNSGADALCQGGKLGIFTPMFFFLAKKPD